MIHDCNKQCSQLGHSWENTHNLLGTSSHLSPLTSQTSHTFLSPLSSHSTNLLRFHALIIKSTRRFNYSLAYLFYCMEFWIKPNKNRPPGWIKILRIIRGFIDPHISKIKFALHEIESSNKIQIWLCTHDKAR